MSSESSIQESIISYINSMPNGTAENVSGNAQQSGRADINACVYGRTLKIEVKTEDTPYGRKGASTKQRLYLEKWARAGALSMVVYSLEDVRQIISNFGLGEFVLSNQCKTHRLTLSGRGKWYDVQNKRWVDISH